MSKWLRPVGRRPSGFLSVAGFLLAGLLYCTAVSIFAPGLVGFALMQLPPLDSLSRLAVGLAYLVAISLLVPFLLLANSDRLPRLTWATWWLLLTDVLLRVASAIALLAGAPVREFNYGWHSFVMYDFSSTRWTAAFASIVTAACTLMILGIFSRRGERSKSRRDPESRSQLTSISTLTR